MHELSIDNPSTIHGPSKNYQWTIHLFVQRWMDGWFRDNNEFMNHIWMILQIPKSPDLQSFLPSPQFPPVLIILTHSFIIFQIVPLHTFSEYRTALNVLSVPSCTSSSSHYPNYLKSASSISFSFARFNFKLANSYLACP